ncbi:MAG: glutamate--tRNA ligase [Nanoarchaeota archaeon]|nr:glutamate--tRNA ligase [Nanoarchaeota archaeon]
MNEKTLSKKTLAYALKNAIAYNGKAQQGAVISSLFHEGLKKEDVKKNIKEISKIVNKVNLMSVEEQKKEFEKLKNKISERTSREGLPELPGAKKGKVVMRFSPAPSGPMHVGNAIVAVMSYLYVKKYGGIFYIRIEDTNPENIYKPAYNLIKKDSEWLFEGKAKIVIQSERMNLYYKYAEELIRKKSAYVCTCSSEKFKKFADFKEDCPCRNNDVEENICRWKKMIDKRQKAKPLVTSSKSNQSKGYKEGGAVLRFKTQEEFDGMKNKNPAMRDFPLARINETPHPLQKKKYRVWPLMNLSVAVDDIELKMTHIIRGKDHKDNAERQKMIYKVFGKKYPWSAFIGRYKFKDLELSKTKIKEGIESGKYSSWDDPQLPTISSLKKRKYKPEAFFKFAEQKGLSEADRTFEKKEFFRLLDSFNT